MVDSVSHRPYIYNSAHDRNDESEKVSKTVQRKTILSKNKRRQKKWGNLPTQYSASTASDQTVKFA